MATFILLFVVVILLYTTLPIPFLSLNSFPHHIGTALKSKKRKRRRRRRRSRRRGRGKRRRMRRRRIDSSTVLTVPSMKMASLHLFTFIQWIFLQCLPCFKLSLKTVVLLDKSFFVSFNIILILFYKYFLHFVRSLSICSLVAIMKDIRFSIMFLNWLMQV